MWYRAMKEEMRRKRANNVVSSRLTFRPMDDVSRFSHSTCQQPTNRLVRKRVGHRQ